MSTATLINDWKTNGGEAFEFSQPEGFCLAMCQYWISLRLKGEGGNDLMARFLGKNMQQRCRNRQSAIGSRKKSIPGAAKHKEGRKEFGFGSLRGRTEVLAKIMATRGLYTYDASGMMSSGHAIAFDTTLPDLYFMDPNFGQVWFNGCGNGQDGFFDQWFRDYWNDPMWQAGAKVKSYKRLFHLGDKTLRRYTLQNAAQLMI